MRDQELELIAALVEGRLEDETEARALIASSPQMQAEYEAQKTAYLALSTAGSAPLSETERAALRRDIWTELRTPPSAAPVRTPWYYRWVPALAGMFIVVGLVAVLSQGDGGEDSAVEGAAPLSADTTEGASAEAADGDSDAVGGEEEPMEETDTTAVASADDRSLAPAGIDFYTAQASILRSGAIEQDLSDEDAPSPEEAAAPCLEAARLAGYVPLTILTAPIETDQVDTDAFPIPSESNPVIVAIPEGADLSSAVIAFVDQGNCEVIHVDE